MITKRTKIMMDPIKDKSQKRAIYKILAQLDRKESKKETDNGKKSK